MKNRKMIKYLSVFVVMAMVFSFAACTTPQPQNSSTPAPTTAAATEASTPAPASTSAEPTATPEEPASAAYNPPIEITLVSALGTVNYKDGDTIENNVWTRYYEKTYGIKLKSLWSAPSEQFAMKFSIAIASQDLPDVMDADAVNFKKLLDNDMLADLTEAYDKYASPLTKEIVMQDGGAGLQTATFGGKLMAIPETNSIVDNALMLFIRNDWLKKLNLTAPTTLNEMITVAEAFKNQDPDGNGKNDTYGLAVSKEALGSGSWLGSLDGIFSAYHAAPTAWIKDASGKLVYGGIQPEMKTALAKIQEMYKAGLIDPEFGVKDASKVGDDCNAGKLGIAYGVMWIPGWPLQTGKDSDPATDWKPYPLISADDKPAKVVLGSPVGVWHVVNKNCKYPEVAVKFSNAWVDLSYGPNADPLQYSVNADGEEKFKLSLFRVWPATKNVDAHLAVVNALQTGDASKLNPEQKGYYDRTVKFNNGDNSCWGTATIFGPGGTQSICAALNASKDWVYNEFYGAPLPSMQEYQATLNKIRDETFLKIIMGEATVDEFDNYVSQWNSLGGELITAEVNAWYKAKS